MIRRTLTAAAVLTLLATPAYAFHCPKDVKAIDAALSSGKVASAQMSTVKKLRDEGNALHKAGKHKESVGKLAEAMRLILNGK